MGSKDKPMFIVTFSEFQFSLFCFSQWAGFQGVDAFILDAVSAFVIHAHRSYSLSVFVPL